MKPMSHGATAGVVLAFAGAAAGWPDYSYSGPPVEIPDGTGTATPGAPGIATVTVDDSAAITHLSCAVYIAHTFQGDLMLTLTHVETGHSVMLIDRPYVPQTALGFPAPDYGTPAAMMQFDDSGASVYDVPGVTPPGIIGVSGIWKPQAALSGFTGESGQGTWRLSATDNAGGDTGVIVGFRVSITGAGACYPNCDGSSTAPVLNVNDFQCFLNKYASGDAYANCDGSVVPPVLNIVDFQCFLNKFAIGCS